MSENKLSKNPISVCLMQLKFSEIASMRSYISEIQDSYRKKGLPFFKEGKSQRIERGQPDNVRVFDFDFFVFHDAEQTELVQLTENSFSYHVYSYQGYEKAKERFIQLFEIVSRICDFSTVTIISFGLRYANAIEGPNWRDYLDKDFFWMSIKSPYIVQNGFDSVSALEMVPTSFGDGNHGLLKTQLLQNTDGLTVPPDIMTIAPQKLASGKKVSALDIDHIVPFKKGVSIPEVFSVIDGVHDVCHDVFFGIISEKARKEWQ